MNKNYNIEELKYLVADHLCGQISESDKDALEKALLESSELREFYEDVRKTFEFVQEVKFEDPAPHYWNSLLPRIHQKIDERKSKAFSWDKIAASWKILLPVAVILLIAIIYYLARPVDPGVTKDDRKIEDLKKDTAREQPEKKQEEVSPKVDNTAKDHRVPKEISPKRRNTVESRQDNIVKEEQPSDIFKEPSKEPVREGFTAMDIEEISIFGGGEAAGLDEETENELKKLNDNEKKTLLQKLEDINL